MGYIPESQRTTGWYLFNKLFQVRINPHHARTADEIKRYGTPTTGNEDVDREMDKYEQIVMWSIARLEAHFSSGYPVKFVKRSDCDEVYRLLQNHLMAMQQALTVSENVTGNPETMAELVRLDQFAEAVFQYARHGMRDSLEHAGFARRARARDPFAKLGSKIRNRQLETDAPKETLPGGSSVGRQYGTHADMVAQTPPVVNENGVMELDPIVEDPNLPRRTSLAKLFEERRQLGLQWK
jgi:hypothetical protein